jgi:DNA-binding NarL/FixJ family response regulator
VARGEQSEARTTYEVALAAPVSADDTPLYRALLAQSYGELLLSGGDRRGGGNALREAYAGFQQLAARPFMDRAAAELAHAGQVLPEPEGMAGPLVGLTGRERELARLVARGVTNEEAAHELFLSVKTVEYHLSHVYTKLGVSGRAELRARLSGGAADGTPARSRRPNRRSR